MRAKPLSRSSSGSSGANGVGPKVLAPHVAPLAGRLRVQVHLVVEQTAVRARTARVVDTRRRFAPPRRCTRSARQAPQHEHADQCQQQERHEGIDQRIGVAAFARLGQFAAHLEQGRAGSGRPARAARPAWLPVSLARLASRCASSAAGIERIPERRGGGTAHRVRRGGQRQFGRRPRGCRPAPVPAPAPPPAVAAVPRRPPRGAASDAAGARRRRRDARGGRRHRGCRAPCRGRGFGGGRAAAAARHILGRDRARGGGGRAATRGGRRADALRPGHAAIAGGAAGAARATGRGSGADSGNWRIGAAATAGKASIDRHVGQQHVAARGLQIAARHARSASPPAPRSARWSACACGCPGASARTIQSRAGRASACRPAALRPRGTATRPASAPSSDSGIATSIGLPIQTALGADRSSRRKNQGRTRVKAGSPRGVGIAKWAAK